MNKFCFIFGVMAATVVSVSATVWANSRQGDEHCIHTNVVVATHVEAQGKHCSGTVGCSCSGFAPITNGELWQRAYCKHCGHKKSCHR